MEKSVINDSIAEDAFAVGIDEYAKVIDNGDGSLGTVLHRTSSEFKEIYKKAEVVIAKGQANYEYLSEENKNIYFLLMTKLLKYILKHHMMNSGNDVLYLRRR